ncbi:hypothetical protein C8R44DRAFT_756806 [Mycena epipterygia]|nr:hypothetical protein C8R44DRAFT_756806 [Mycena epipterygia]
MPTDVVSLKRRDPNIILYVGSDNDWEGRLFCFERGPHSLVIQTPELKLPGYTGYNGEDPEADRQYISTFNVDLEKLTTLARNIVFGETNWAYLVTRKDGSYRLHYREKPIRPISSPAWAPMIPETDLVYTKYITAEDREAVWNGREVDCFVGWCDRWREHVDCAMKGHRLLEGLDVTFEVLGHIVRNGDIIGLMTEHPVDDRLVEYKDRAAVYAAVRKVQSRGLIISLNETGISIHNGKVRLLGTQSVRKFSEVEDPEDAAEKFHWRTLSSIFDALRQHPNIAPPLRCFQPDIVPFLPAPSPEKPLVTDFFFGMIVHVLALFMPEQQDEWSGGSTLSRKTRRPKSVTTIALRMDSDHDGLILRSSRPRISMRPYTRQRPLLASPDSDE